MRLFTRTLTAVLLSIAGAAALPAYADSDNPVEFDAELAAELGADDYGMKRYVMAFLKSGPNRPEDPEEAQALQRAHLDNIRRMAEVESAPRSDEPDGCVAKRMAAGSA